MVLYGGPGTDDPGPITYPRIMPKSVLQKAYGLKSDQIACPAWLDDYSAGNSVFFTITATMPPDTTVDQFQLMLQNLLAECFYLAAHHEMKEFPGFKLVVAAGGSKLKEDGQEDAGAPPDGPIRNGSNGFPIRKGRFAWSQDDASPWDLRHDPIEPQGIHG